MRRSTVLACLLAALGFPLASCKQRPSSADPKLIGGVDADQEIHPWSVRLSIVNPDNTTAMCTGTFVSPSTLLTASHCLHRGSRVFVPRYNDVASVAVYKNPLHGGSVDRFDVAVVVFPEGTAGKFTSLASRMPRMDEVVSFIGYGSCTVWDGRDAGTRRCMGSNTVSQVNPDGMIFSLLGRGPSGVTISPGDSGGPMFIDTNRIAGVASGGGYGRDSSHANLLMQSNLDFLREVARNEGVAICGLDGRECEGAGVGGADDLVAATNRENGGADTPQSPGGESFINSGRGPQVQSQAPEGYDESRQFTHRGRVYYCPPGMTLRIRRNNSVYCSR